MKAVLAVILATVLLVGFQNCAKNKFADASGQESLSKTQQLPLGVDTITQFNFPYDGSGKKLQLKSLSINLTTGLVEIDQLGSGLSSCYAEENLLASLENLFASARLCEGEISGDQLACQALGIPDVQLGLASGEDVVLQPIMCGTGLDLCGDDSRSLRTLLRELAHNPPPGCVSSP